MDIETFRQMVLKKPDGFLGRYGLGDKIMKNGGNLEEAVEDLQVAAKLGPVPIASPLALGRALVGLNRKDEAKTILKAGIDVAIADCSNGGGDLVPEMHAIIQSLG